MGPGSGASGKPSASTGVLRPNGIRMRIALLVLVGVVGAPLQDPSPSAERLLQPGDLAARQVAAQRIGEAMPARDATALIAALRTAALLLPVGSAARARVDALLRADVDAEHQRHDAEDLVDDLTFRPVVEAELPKGVPGFQALDELEMRVYPAYRMVRTNMRGGSMGAFWPLFRHIESNEIAMTAPVQIDWSADERRATTMAFLYGAPDIGKTGVVGNVEVVDVPAMTVVTVGSRGYERASRVEELRTRLVAWIAASAEYEAAGPMRTMVYNSPSVGAERRYFEVQIPLRLRAKVPSAPAAIR